MRPRLEAAEGVDAEALWRSVSHFLGGYAPWSWWVTLTFGDDVSEHAAARAFRDWCTALARRVVHDHVPVGWAWELQRRGLPAYHALIAVPVESRFSAALGDAYWKRTHRAAGVTRIERYVRGRGAPWYVAAHRYWDVNVACPRAPVCRRPGRGCVVARVPW